jgi:hypothetical protein
VGQIRRLIEEHREHKRMSEKLSSNTPEVSLTEKLLDEYDSSLLDAHDEQNTRAGAREADKRHVEVRGRVLAALSAASETRAQEPSGYAVVTKEGAFVGIWRGRDTAESIVNRSQGSAAGERIVPMFEASPLPETPK